MADKEQHRILVVDDDPGIRISLNLLCKQSGFAVNCVASPQEAFAEIAIRPPNLVILDMNFSVKTGGQEGLETLRRLRSELPRVPVILMTAWGTIELAVTGMREGAFDFLPKPWSNAKLLQTIRTALSLADTSRSGTPLSRESLDKRHDFSAIVGQAPALVSVLASVGRVAATDAPVLIMGESGTGKDLIAHALHANSHRRDKPFVKVNLGGISGTLFESEMFGHVRGAFTDAFRNRTGRFGLAEGGTIFLDEIGDLDISSQVKLLRVLQDGTFEPLGSSRTQCVDVRVVSATNKDLAKRVANGAFREDLFYRINLIQLQMPPLAARRIDIPLLARHFLAELGRDGAEPAPEWSPGALQWLTEHPWPGNIRELRNTVERVFLEAGERVLTPEDLVRATEGKSAPPEPGIMPPVGSMTIEDMEKRMIRNALDFYNGNVARAALSLGLTRSALYRRLEKFGIVP